MSLDLKRVNPDQNIFSKNMELTPTLFTLYWGLNKIEKIEMINFLRPHLDSEFKIIANFTRANDLKTRAVIP